ncbi:hypothetical protein [Bosea sp. 47.2.35]|uniref:hypothetical protein n=1 Tax=Bosea sp. 47.2.35 TaxID=2969304 RepID=UPI0021500363|nr:hypothetical protein [Bosea sp. 47.2.35]MCR4524336.1 hypothetical protein [Bosea sp. 47.2.35]
MASIVSLNSEAWLLIAIALFMVGFAVSFAVQVFVLVPIAVVVVASFTLGWFLSDQLDLFRVGVLIGYLFALNVGYLIGTAFAAGLRISR